MILGDGAYGDNTEFRARLEQRNLLRARCQGRHFGLPQEVGVSAAISGHWPPPKAAIGRTLIAARAGARRRPGRHGEGHLAGGHPRKDDAGSSRSRSGRRTSSCAASEQRRAGPPGVLAAASGLRQARAGQVLAIEPARRHPLEDLVRLGKLRWRIEQDYRELKDALGLDHFEGRTYPGWNHHVTLVSVAHAFLTLERHGCAPDSGRQPDPLPGRPGAPSAPACWHGTCPTCRRELPPEHPLRAPPT